MIARVSGITRKSFGTPRLLDIAHRKDAKMAPYKSSRLALIPTEVTPLPTPSQSQSPSPPPSPRPAAAAVTASSSKSTKTTRSSATPVSHGFVALQVLLSSGSVPGLQETTQHIYLRRQDAAATATAAAGDASDNAEDAPSIAVAAGCSIFAVNLPHGSTTAAVKHGIEALLHARAGAARAAAARSASGKGKQKEISEGAATAFNESTLR